MNQAEVELACDGEDEELIDGQDITLASMAMQAAGITVWISYSVCKMQPIRDAVGICFVEG